MADGPEKDEKTEEATPKRLEEARDKGQVAFSSETMAGATLVGSALALLLAGPALANAAGDGVVEGLARLRTLGLEELDAAAFAALLGASLRDALLPMLLFVAPFTAIAWIAGYGQVGFRITPKATELDPSKLSPAKGAQKIFSKRSLVRTGLATLKVGLVFGVVVAAVTLQVGSITPLAGQGVREVLPQAFGVLARTAGAAVLTVVALAVIDLVYQRFQHKQDMRMTRKEVRDEQKNTDGDPQVKARIRRVQREMASRRMMQDVPDATVVVTNPEHYAVALQYSEGGGSAPRVVAKGVDEVAQRIKAVAREHGVFLFENPPLARALHRQAEIGDPIPEGLYQAVANVLAYVFRVQGRAAGAAQEPAPAAV